jgi:maltooligosyltrehalose synthase
VPIRPRGLLGESPLPLIPQDAWGDTRIALPKERAERRWRNALTDETVRAEDASISVAETLKQFPVALLVAD